MSAKRKLRSPGTVTRRKARVVASESATEADNSSGLLLLPHEIRHIIWEYAVAENSRIFYTSRLATPSLTRACKQIRFEALLLWLKHNPFMVLVLDYDPAILQQMTSFFDNLQKHLDCLSNELRAQRSRPTDVTVEFELRGRQHPSNLKKWAKLVWEQRLPAWQTNHDAPHNAKVLLSALNIAMSYIGRSWEACENTLDNMLFAVGSYDPKWDDSIRPRL